MSEVVSQAEQEEITKLVNPLVLAAREFRVVSRAGYSEAGDRLMRIKTAQKELAAKKKKVLDPALAAVKAIRDLFAGPEAEIAEAEGLYKRVMIAFDDEQERIRQEEQRKLDDIARREREKNEAAARKALEDAEAARQAGDKKKAERLEQKAEVAADRAATVVAATVQAEPPRVSGASIREIWSAIVTDRKALIAAVAAGTVPELALEPNMKFLDNQARALKRDLKYPGVTATVEKSLAARSK
jgi:hypothetical protein